MDTYLPVQTVAEDVSVMRGPHTMQFGGVFRSIRNRREAFGTGYHFAKQAGWGIQDWDTLESLLPAAPANSGTFREYMATTLGVINFIQANYNFDLGGNPLPVEDPTRRTYGKEELELYFQDTWRVKPGLTFTGGLRWSLIPPVREVNGQQVSITPRLGDYIALRQELAEAGRPTREAGSIGYAAANSGQGGALWDTRYTNFSPRLAVAFSPQARDGLLGKLFGGPGKTSVRAGAGLFYNIFGMGMIQMLDRNAFGLSTSLTQSSGRLATAPRFSGLSDIPAAGLSPPPGGGPARRRIAAVGARESTPPCRRRTASIRRSSFRGNWAADSSPKSAMSAGSDAGCSPTTPPRRSTPTSGILLRGSTWWMRSAISKCKSATAVRSPLSARSRFGRTCIRMPPRRK